MTYWMYPMVDWLTFWSEVCYIIGMGHDSEVREFMLVVRDALLMIVRWIEKKYGKQAAN